MSAQKRVKCRRRLARMSARTRGSSTRLKNRCAILAFRLDANSRVAWKVACGVHASGAVRYSTSSQLASAGMILNALGTLPLL